MSFNITMAFWNMDGISFLKTDPEKRKSLKALIIRQSTDDCILKYSLEIEKIKCLNFLDLCPEKGSGTKRKKSRRNAALTLDYISAGPVYYAFDPHAVKRKLEKTNRPPLYEIKVSDHYPIIASFPCGREFRS